MSTYSPDLRITLITTGDQAGTWGTTTNTNLGTIIEDAISGFVSVSVTSAAQAFTALDGVADQARNAMIQLTTSTVSTSFAVYAPPVSKQYIIWNNTAQTATIYNSTVLGNTTAAGVGVAIASGDRITVFSNGSNFYAVKASNITGTLDIANGGTGQTTQQTAINALAGAVTSGSYLRGNGTNVVMSTIQAADLPTATDSANGAIKLGSATAQSVAANTVTATASRSYALQLNGTGQGIVNVPWTDTVYTLPAATSTVLGGIELGSGTVQSVAANAVTATASRTYALQVNSDGQGVVNVPWTDTSTSPGGSTTQVQYNNAGAFAGSANMTFNGTALSLANDATISGLTVGRGAGSVSSNTAVGTSALASATSVVSSTAIGYQAGNQVTSTNRSTFVGTTAGYYGNGDDNVAVGRAALYGAFGTTLSINTRSTAVGNEALYYTEGSDDTVALGYRSQFNAIDVTENTGVGTESLFNNVLGDYQTAMGFRSMYNMLGASNTALGHYSMRGSTTPANNTGQNNVAVGVNSLLSLTSGTANTTVGYSSGSSITTGSNNVIIGGYTGSAAPISATGSNYVVLSDGAGNIRAFWNAANATFNGNLGIGGTSPSTSGTGITFPATQSSSSDVNTLDDYEEGTFTPTIYGGTVAGTGTYNTYGQVGNYVKIGKLVKVQIRLSWSAHTGTGDMGIDGLPFPSASVIGVNDPAALTCSNIALTASNVLTAEKLPYGSTIILRQYPVGGGAETNVPVDTSGILQISCVYIAAA